VSVNSKRRWIIRRRFYAPQYTAVIPMRFTIRELLLMTVIAAEDVEWV
jgi:hypothetical protein